MHRSTLRVIGLVVAGLLTLMPARHVEAITIILDFDVPATPSDFTTEVGVTCRTPGWPQPSSLPICPNWTNFDYGGFRFSPLSLWMIREPENYQDAFDDSNFIYWGNTSGQNPDYLGPAPESASWPPLYIDFYGKPFSLESFWLVYDCWVHVTSSAGGDSRANRGSTPCLERSPDFASEGLVQGLNEFVGPEWTDITYLVIWGSNPAAGQGIDNLTLSYRATIPEPQPYWLLMLALPLVAIRMRLAGMIFVAGARRLRLGRLDDTRRFVSP